MSAEISSKSTSLLKGMFYENNVRSDRFSRIVLFLALLIYLLSGILNFFNLYENFAPDYYIIYFSLSAILFAGAVGSWIVPQPMRKWIIIGSIVVSNAVCHYFFYAYASLIYMIPIFLSVLYYQKKFTVQISLMAWLCFLVSVAVNRNSFFAAHDLIFIVFSIALPQTFVMAISAFIGARTAGIGRHMVLKQFKSVSKIAAMEQDIAMSAKRKHFIVR